MRCGLQRNRVLFTLVQPNPKHSDVRIHAFVLVFWIELIGQWLLRRCSYVFHWKVNLEGNTLRKSSS